VSDPARKELLRVELTMKAEEALSKMVKVSLLKHHAPTIVSDKSLELLCKICYDPIGGLSTGGIFICNECGELYHQDPHHPCIDFVRNNSPLMPCANPSCLGRTKNLTLLQTVKPVI